MINEKQIFFIFATITWFTLQFLFVKHVDKQAELKISRKTILYIFLIAFLSFFTVKSDTTSEALLYGIFTAYLCFNVLTDLSSNDVYIHTHIVPLLLGVFMIIGRLVKKDIGLELIPVLCLYFLLQEFVFGKLYAKGDCRICCISALYYSCYFGNWKSMLLMLMLHMVLATFIFLLDNLFSKNISKGRLKKPAAFVPSIALASLFFM